MSPRRIAPEDLERAGEVRFEFYRSSGPGGQNVNKVATAVRLRFDLRGSRLLPGTIRERLAQLAGRRLTSAGSLVIESMRYRTQERNRADAIDRLRRLLERAYAIPAVRRPTRPPPQSRRRRLDEKRRRARTKLSRGKSSRVED
jgi:ribosome-associated protein